MLVSCQHTSRTMASMSSSSVSGAHNPITLLPRRTRYLCLLLLLLSVTLLQDHVEARREDEGRTGCSFDRDGCTYNIYLSRKDGDVGDMRLEERTAGCGELNKRVVLEDQVQNDYTAKLDNMEKSFSFVKDAHEQRLKELEGTIQKLVDTKAQMEDSAETTRVSSRLRQNRHRIGDPSFMRRLEREFDSIRKELREKSSQLLDAELKLNQTSTRMHEQQLENFKNSQQLVNAENQISALKRERAILKNNLKDRIYKLDKSSVVATECEKKSTEQEDKILELFRSESTLKEDLLMTQSKLNRSRKEHSLLQRKHSALKSRQERIRKVMKIREKELIDCYSAKTSTFCGFEDPKICGFTNINDTSDFFDWARVKGKTPSSRTGPSKDHSCDAPTGHFMYIEASAKGRGSNAILYSPLYRGLSQQCVEFYYHMYGRHVGTLNVYAKAPGDMLTAAWRAYGNQGDHWTLARLAIPKALAMAGYQIAFEGITENGYQGDISIDDVSVMDGPCPVDERLVPARVEVNSTTLNLFRTNNKVAQKLRRRSRRRRGRQ